MNRLPNRSLLCALCCLLPAMPAAALTSDRDQPIQIEADQGSLDQAKQTTEFSGNVVIKQGTMYIEANRVKVVRAATGTQTLTATGSPVRFGQQLDREGEVKGQGAKVEYQSATGIVRITGNARIDRGGDSARGEVITYNTRTEVYTVMGGNKNNANRGRVNVIIQPQK